MAGKRQSAQRRTPRSEAPKQTTRAAATRTSIGSGGELHQRGSDPLTTNHGAPISDNQNSLRAAERGPTLLEDFALREKIFHFDHERIPERIVHARGTGAHGYFECTKAIPQLTSANLFQQKGERVPVFVRFSTVAGGAGSVDTPRDVRGFAVKFYTREGNWDLVGNNIPVFFIQDAIKFPDLVHSVKMAESFADHYSQARLFFRSQTPIEQAHIASAFVFELSKVGIDPIRERMVANLRNVDDDLAARVAKGLGIPLPKASPPKSEPYELDPSPALSIVMSAKPTLRGRKVGVLFTHGSSASEIDRVVAAVTEAGAVAVKIAPQIRAIETEPKSTDADGQLAGTPSVTCDAIALVLDEQGARELCEDGAAVQFVADAFAHLKAIGASDGAKPLLERAGVIVDEGVVGLGADFVAAAALRSYDREPLVRLLA